MRIIFLMLKRKDVVLKRSVSKTSAWHERVSERYTCRHAFEKNEKSESAEDDKLVKRKKLMMAKKEEVVKICLTMVHWSGCGDSCRRGV